MPETTERDLVTEVEELLAKATPGPWEVLAADDYFVEAPSATFKPSPYVDANMEAPTVCRTVVEVGNQTEDCGEANANLIARSPELLRRLVEEVKQDRDLLRECLSYVLSSAEASRMMDGFDPQEHKEDRLAARLVDAIGDDALRKLLFRKPTGPFKP